jgi:hypothetical protein
MGPKIKDDYTVIGFYEDTQQVFIDHVTAHNVTGAYQKSAKGKQCCLRFVACLLGHLYPQSQHDHFRFVKDYQ